MFIQLTDLHQKHKLAVDVSNIKYLEDYADKHSKIYLANSSQYLFIQESLEEVCEIINSISRKNTVSINVYHSKSLFGK